MVGVVVTNIIKYPNKILSKVSLPVSKDDIDTKNIIEELIQTAVYNKNCIGLSAPQIGYNKRIILVKNTEDNIFRIIKNAPLYYIMINPEITSKSDELFTYNEGCLSFPNVYEYVKRPKEIDVIYYDVNFQKQSISAKNLMSTCIQHEIDHLNGIMFIDNVSGLRRNRALKKYKTQKEE